MRRKTHNYQQEIFWDKIATKRDNEGYRSPEYPALKEMKDFFQFFGARKNDRILEVGCGTGRYTLPLLQKGCAVHGTEISAGSLKSLQKQAKDLGVQKKLTVKKDALEDPKKSQTYAGKFNKALMVAVIHHFDPAKRGQIFENIVNSLKKGGEVTALEPNPLNPFYYCLYFYRWLFNKQGVNRWSTETGMLFTNIINLKRLYAQAGLKQIEIKRYAFFPSAAGRYFPVFLKINDYITNTPFLREFSAYIWIKGRKP
ncbi:MAG: class I SAM-dependent methyltransferase [Patescibacteria group bacterium]